MLLLLLLLLLLQDEVGAAGLTTVSNASFSGTTRFIGNEWGALQTRGGGGCSGCPGCWDCSPETISGIPLAVSFDGPLVLQDNSMAVNFPSTWPYNATAMESIPSRGAGVHAVNTMLLVKGPTITTGHMQDAVVIQQGTAQFLGAFTARDNQISSGPSLPAIAVLYFYKVRATFHGSFVCAQDTRPSQAIPAATTELNTACISAFTSKLDFRNTVTAINNLGTGWNAPVLGCFESDIRFRGRAQISGNARKRAWSDDLQASGSVSDEDSAGGAWQVRDCRIVADKRVTFYDNSAIAVTPAPGNVTYGAGGAVSADNSSLVFKGGLEVVGNEAPRGGGLHLTGSLLRVSGGSFVCKNNVAARQGGCMYAVRAYGTDTPPWGLGSVILWNSTSSCVQNNSASNVTVTDDSGMYFDPAGGVTGPCLAALAIVDSKVNYVGSGHMFGNNHSPAGTTSCDIAAFKGPDRGYNASETSFSCDGAQKRSIGAYNIGGDVCGSNCTSNNCTCPSPAEWSVAACKCT
uniref:Right handed beta helix domain-containing protein n=1 Tax=Tetradesmus obliquus TaxID=3088 RepID=A0A383V5Q5_TETOB|eukprot:jgi/Sobl393_1/9206/SZX60938.1